MRRPDPPSMMINMNHGMEWPNGHEYQVARRALLRQDWPGLGMPPRWEHCLTAADIGDVAHLHGLVAFLFAYDGAGTPAIDQFLDVRQKGARFRLQGGRSWRRCRSGCCRTPTAHRWPSSGTSSGPETARSGLRGLGSRLRPFRNLLSRFLKGEPVGCATNEPPPRSRRALKSSASYCFWLHVGTMDGSSQGSEPRRFGGRASIHVRDRLPGRQPCGPGGVHLVIAGRVLQALCRRRNAAYRVAPGGRSLHDRSLDFGKAVVPRGVGEVGLHPEPGGGGSPAMGTFVRVGGSRLPVPQQSVSAGGRDGPQGPPLAGGLEKAAGADQSGGGGRRAGGRPAGAPLGAVEPGLRRTAHQGRVPEGAGYRALAAILVGPLQPDQRAAS